MMSGERDQPVSADAYGESEADETCVDYRCMKTSSSASGRQCGVEVCSHDERCVESDGAFHCR